MENDQAEAVSGLDAGSDSITRLLHFTGDLRFMPAKAWQNLRRRGELHLDLEAFNLATTSRNATLRGIPRGNRPQLHD